jgi:hypothetical protein
VVTDFGLSSLDDRQRKEAYEGATEFRTKPKAPPVPKKFRQHPGQMKLFENPRIEECLKLLEEYPHRHIPCGQLGKVDLEQLQRHIAKGVLKHDWKCDGSWSSTRRRGMLVERWFCLICGKKKEKFRHPFGSLGGNPKPPRLGTIMPSGALIQVIGDDMRWKTLATVVDAPNPVRAAVAKLVRKGVDPGTLWVRHCWGEREMWLDTRKR